MSSIYQAVAADLRGGRPSRGNPIVQNDRSFRDDGNINADIEKQRQTDALIRKQARMQEGGRSGGYNDRRDIATRDKRAAEAENGYDDFGRRVVPNREGDKKQRAQAALARLRKKTGGPEEDVAAKEPGPRSRSRPRSRSQPRSRKQRRRSSSSTSRS